MDTPKRCNREAIDAFYAPLLTARHLGDRQVFRREEAIDALAVHR